MSELDSMPVSGGSDDVLDAREVREAVARLIGAVKHGAIFVGLTPDGYDGATKDDVIAFAADVAELLDEGWVVVRGEGLQHGAELEHFGYRWPKGNFNRGFHPWAERVFAVRRQEPSA